MILPFDSYSLRARLFPALIATAPAITLAATLVTWSRFHVSQLFATLVLGVLLFAFSDFARRQGLRIQPKLFPDGFPTTTWLRHRDRTLHAETKKRIVAFVGAKLGRKPPTPEQEEASAADADAFYDDGIRWLRDHTREPAKAFKLVLEENITYGFRRNLFGMKKIGLLLGAGTAILSTALAAYRYLGDPAYDMTAFVLVLIVAAIHAFYFLFVVTPASVTHAADYYARQLLASAELLMDKPPTAASAKAKA